MRIQAALQRAHQIPRYRIFVASQFLDLQLSDAVLGTDTAAMRCHQVVNHVFDGIGARQEFCRRLLRGLAEIEMQIAITQMSIGHHARARRRCQRCGAGCRDELRDGRDRQ